MPTATKAPPSRARTSPRTVKKAAARGGQPDALRLLVQDHRAVDAIFKQLEALGPRAHTRRQQLVAQVTKALSVHAAIEELVLYPAARREVPATNGEVLEALEEHHIVKWTLSELQDLDPKDERYPAKIAVLIESVRHHVKEEEKELFPQLRKALGADELRDLGSALAAAKTAAPTRPHPRSPDTPPGNVVAQVLVAPLDAAANLTEAAAKRVRKIVG